MSMTIDRIGNPDPVQSGRKPGQNSRAAPADQFDTIDLSSEAVERSEFMRLVEIAAAAPDVREDRVAEMRAKINDPSYLDEKIIGETAGRILDLFGFR
jgi:negative regulator of flagellin synthesis FlgM